MSVNSKTDNDALLVEVVARRLACENSKFYVYFDHVIDSAGYEVEDYLVVSPKNTGNNLVTGVAILTICDGKIGLIRIYRPAIRDYSWEIPHGFVDEGESECTSAIRELLEETGMDFTGKTISSMGYITPDSGVLAARVHLYLANAPHTKAEVKTELGLREFRYFSEENFEAMIVNSKIQDTFTLAAWCKYQLLKALGSKHA
jgi:ADP-ribose pyrophosphatase